MNDVQCLIDRQLGLSCRFGYDNVLKRLVVREAESFQRLGAAGELEPPIFACRFAEIAGHEHVLALANEDGRVAIQNTSKANAESSLEGFECHNNAVFDLAWMPRNLNFVTVSGDHTACLWDVADGSPKRVLVFSSHTRSVKTAVFRPTEPSVFATGARDGNILLWDIRASNRPAIVLKPDNMLMNCHSSFAPKTPGSHSKRPRIDSQRAISITGLVFQNDLTLISCGECDGNIKVWDLRKNYSIYTREPLPKHAIPYCGSSTRNGYTNLIVDDSRVRLYASCMDNVIYCFNISTYNTMPERRYIGHENGTFYIKTGLSPDGQYLISGSSDKNAYIWNVRSSLPVVRLAGHHAEVTCAAWARTPHTTIVTCSDDARHHVWRIGSEFEEPLELRGRAELVPRAELAPPPWGAPGTPSSLKRRNDTTPSSRRAKRHKPLNQPPKTKRCLTDLMNAARDSDDETPRKKAHIEVAERPLLPAGIKRSRDTLESTSPKRRRESESDSDSAPKTCDYTTPTKDERKILSSRSPNMPESPGTRINKFTAALPDYVVSGEAPHLRLMSPVKRKMEAPDWLTLISREKRGKLTETLPAPPSPNENAPVRRNSVSEKTPKAAKKTRTLLKYFSVAIKE